MPHQQTDEIFQALENQLQQLRQEIKADMRGELLEARSQLVFARSATRVMMKHPGTAKIHSRVTQVLLAPPPKRPPRESAVAGGGVLVELLNRSFASSIEVVNLQDIRFTQKKCSSRFSDGRPLRDTIRELNNGKFGCQPFVHHEWLCLCLVRFPNNPATFLSIDNRRLHCLNQHQRFLQRPVWVLGYMVTPTDRHNMQRFLNHLDTSCCGEEIRIRD